MQSVVKMFPQSILFGLPKRKCDPNVTLTSTAKTFYEIFYNLSLPNILHDTILMNISPQPKVRKGKGV